ncbi:MAG: ergothioneine biosynthesis protein EgtB [Rhodothermales bacterium]
MRTAEVSTLVHPDATPLASRFQRVRSFTEHLCEPLETEDFVVQSMPDVSPTKWHLAHTTWFFETFILSVYDRDYIPYHPGYAFLFNSYYLQAGERHCRAQRGYISRPTVREVFAYRAHLDDAMLDFLARADEDTLRTIAPLIEIGLHHEQQHQELLVTDIKHVLSVNPLRPSYQTVQPEPHAGVPPVSWIAFDEGLYEIGHAGEGFAYDNETPRHRVFLEDFELANRLVTNGDFMAFIEDGGYQRGPLWLSAGWATVQAEEWTEPFYWERKDGQWVHYTLGGERVVNPDEPLTHISYFEADAFARWADARLPTEAEWEVAAQSVARDGHFVESGRLHPKPLAPDADPRRLHQMYGDVWEWTRSQYEAYPGYRPAPGALGEYNGKFMCNQFVLRGGSCATSETHIRASYRNFFPPDATWQFTGLRLAR